MARMTIDQLQIFLAVAQHMHFTRAAEELYITQPSVSAAIQSLEEQYGVKVFNRVGRWDTTAAFLGAYSLLDCTGWGWRSHCHDNGK